MKRTIGISGAILAGAIGLAGSSGAIDVSQHGTICLPQAGMSTTSKAAYGLFGIHNTDTAASLVTECGSVLAPAGVVTNTLGTVYDRNSSTDTCCLIRLQDTGGNVVSSANRCSSGSGSAAQFLQFQPPAGTVAAIANWTCTIPPQTAAGLSHVTRFVVATQ